MSIKVTLPAAALLALTAAHAQFVVPGNGDTSFGGPIGTSSLAFDLTGSTVNSTLSITTGGFFDTLVLYIDSIPGGFSDTSSLSDAATGDFLRQAIVGGTDGENVNFPVGFAADFAIAIAVADGPGGPINFGGLWQLDDSDTDQNFVDSVNIAPTDGSTSGNFTFDFDYSEIGLSDGDSFGLVGMYLNPDDGGDGTAGDTFYSSEGFGGSISGFGNSSITFSDFVNIPEPAAAPALLGLALALSTRRRA